MATLFKGRANILKSFIYENLEEIVTLKARVADKVAF